MMSHPVLIIQSNCCLNVIVELPRDENVRVPSPRDTVVKLHLKKIQVHIQVYKESNISVYVIII